MIVITNDPLKLNATHRKRTKKKERKEIIFQHFRVESYSVSEKKMRVVVIVGVHTLTHTLALSTNFLPHLIGACVCAIVSPEAAKIGND